MFMVGLVTFPTLTHALIAPLLFLALGDAGRAFHHAEHSRPPAHAQSAHGVSVAGVLDLAVGPGRRVPGGAAVDHGAGRGRSICFPSDDAGIAGIVDAGWRRKWRARQCAGGAVRFPMEFHDLRRASHRLRARQRGLGAADRIRARVRGIARLHLAADSGLGRAGRDRRADRAERHQLLAGVDRGRAGRGAAATGCPTGSGSSSNIRSRISGRCRAIPS